MLVAASRRLRAYVILHMLHHQCVQMVIQCRGIAPERPGAGVDAYSNAGDLSLICSTY